MSPLLALVAFTVLIAALLWQETRRQPGCSGAIWLPVIWLAVLASRPIPVWFGEQVSITEVNSLDRNLFLIQMVAAVLVLSRRNLNWRALLQGNKAVAVLYGFFAVSVLWSDFPYVAFKRWLKEFVNILMILIILTEKDPNAAFMTVFLRCAYMLIPSSVLLIKYYPDLGMGYERWTGHGVAIGVTLGKNMLGATAMILTLFVIAEIVRSVREAGGGDKRHWFALLLTTAMGVYLLHRANSATAVACTAAGSAGLAVLGLPHIRRNPKILLLYLVAGGFLLGGLCMATDLKAKVAEMLGRDATLTGRDEIWKLVLGEKTDPLVGTGFNSFWLGNRVANLSEKNSYKFQLNQAHNGYLELYLNGGVLGVGLLFLVALTGCRKIWRRLFAVSGWASLRLVIWTTVMIYNWSEAAFFRLGPVWFAFLLVVLELPSRANAPNLAPIRGRVFPEGRGFRSVSAYRE